MTAADSSPPRYRWLRRLTLLYLLLALATFALRQLWLRHATARVEAQIAAARAAGQPVLAPDFATKPIPDSQNAAPLLRQAAKAINYNSEEKELLNFRFPGSGTLTPAEQAILHKLVNDRRDILNQIRRARALPGVDWQVRFDQPLDNVLLPHLNEQRQAFELLRAACHVAHAQGDDKEALELLRDMLFISRASSRDPFLISMLVGIAMSSSACSTLGAITPSLNVKDPAARAAAKKLIDELLDDRWIREAAVRGLYGERASQIDLARRAGAANDYINGYPVPWSDRFFAWWGRPLIEEDISAMMLDLSRDAHAAAAPDLPAAKLLGMSPRTAPAAGATSHLLHMVRQTMTPALNTPMLRTYTAQRDARTAAVDLAIALYQADHNQLPQNMNDLVPAYLEQIPIDPTTGAPLNRLFKSATQPSKKPAQ